MPQLDIIGIGLDPRDMTARHLELVDRAEVLVGGTRHLNFFKDRSAEKIRIGADIQAVCREIAGRLDRQKIVVLASGDPLFFGIGSILAEHLGKDRVRIHPNISSVAAAFARIKEPWSEASLLSLHGRRPQSDLAAKLAVHDLCAVLTDRNRTPAWLAAWLIRENLNRFDFCVFECLGSPGERIRWLAVEEAARETFQDPNLVILKRKDAASPGFSAFVPGMPDHWFAHSQGLITKAEVRAVALSRLRLKPGCLVWDLGAGCGSVGIEAALLVSPGQVTAVEQKDERLVEIRENQHRFQVSNLEVVQAELPEGLPGSSKPDRIFIGGGGEKLPEIMAEAAKRLVQGGIMVVNTVLLENVQAAKQTMQDIGLQTDLVQIQVSRSKDMPWGQRLQAQNPVWIVQGIKGND